MVDDGLDRAAERETAVVAGVFGRILRLFGLRLLLGLAVAAGSLLVLLWLTGEVFEGETNAFDQHIRTFFQGYINPTLGTVARGLSFLGSTVFLVATGVATALLFLILRMRREFVIFVIAMAGEILLDLTMKAGFMRPRPEPFFDYPPLESYSYPSGHALASFCFYGVIAWLVAARIESSGIRLAMWAVAVALILTIGLSRVYLGVHYPSDVLAGYLTALIWTCFVAFGDFVLRRRTTKGDI